MGLFGRRQQPVEQQAVEHDPVLTFFDADQADRFRALVRTVLAEHGLETTVHVDHVEDAEGRQFGLGNLAARCHAAGKERRWRAVVQDHVRGLLASVDGPDLLAEMTPEQIRRQVYVRLYDAESLPDRTDFSYAEEPLPGVLALLAVDFPETVSLLVDDDVERLGGAAALRAAGMENLRRVEGLEHRTLTGKGGARVEFVEGESVFTASLALLPPELLERVLGTREAPDGVLVAVPDRHTLLLHVLRDASVVPSLQAMAGMALQGYEQGVGATSPWVYWWRDGAWEQVTRVVDDEVAVTVGPELGDVLERYA